jgi:sortase A
MQVLSRRLQFLFWCAGVLLCCIAIGKYLEMRHYQATENRRLVVALRAKVAGPPPPGRALLSPRGGATIRKAGSLVGRIEIPRLNLSAIVLEGSDNRVLSVGVGRVPDTSEPGAAGNTVLGGHRDTFFRPLRGIRAGDRIDLLTPRGSYKYTVDWTRIVAPENTDLLKATPQPSLTLVTCYPFHYVGPAPQRFIVRAHQETDVVPVSTAQEVPQPSVEPHHPAEPLKRARHSVARRVPPPSRHIARGRADYVATRDSVAPSLPQPRRRSLTSRVLAAARRRVQFKTR